MKISKSFRPKQIRIIEAAVNAALETMAMPGLRGIRIKSTRHKGLHGWADVKSKRIIISLNRELKGAELFTVAIHELTHASQFLRGELKNNSEGFIWRGVPFYCDDDFWQHMPFAMYKSLPWEREAYDSARLAKRLWKKLKW